MSKSFIIKSIQYSLLQEFSFEEVRVFWENISYCYSNNELTELEIQKLYTENSDVPISLFLKIINKAGEVHGPYASILEKNLPKLFSAKSPFVKELLPFAVDVALETLLKTKANPAEAFLDMYPTLINTFLKFYDASLVQKSSKGDISNFTYLANTYRNDDSFFNHNLYIKTICQNFVKIFSTNYNAKYTSYLDINSYRLHTEGYIDTEIINKKIVNMKNGRIIGGYISIEEFLTNHRDIEERDFMRNTLIREFGNYKVVQFYEDVYVVKNRKREKVLSKNVGYGSPLYLYNMSINHKHISDTDLKNLINQLIFYTSYDYSSTTVDMASIQKEYIQYLSLKKANHIEFKDGYVIENGKVISKSIPAKILWYLLTEYKKGKCCFFYKEIILNKDVFGQSESHNISKRLSRLSEMLEKNSSVIRITLSGSGQCMIKSIEDFTIKHWV